MPERTIDKIKRKMHEGHIRLVKLAIRKLVRRFDELNYGAFMAYSWGYDEHTDYHVIAERSYDNSHVYGTQVTYYNEDDRKKAESF